MGHPHKKVKAKEIKSLASTKKYALYYTVYMRTGLNLVQLKTVPIYDDPPPFPPFYPKP